MDEYYIKNNLLETSKNIRVLYVEDDLDVAETTINLLKNFVSYIKHSENGTEALKIFRDEHFDLIITDINMPKMNGIELIHELKKIDIHIPTLVISAYGGDKENMFNAIHEGIDGFILKPIELKQFTNVLTKVLEKNFNTKRT